MTTDESPARARAHDTVATSSMRARQWTIAANYREPADYDVPRLPNWTVYREDGALAFGVGGEVFLRADDPVNVRR